MVFAAFPLCNAVMHAAGHGNHAVFGLVLRAATLNGRGWLRLEGHVPFFVWFHERAQRFAEEGFPWDQMSDSGRNLDSLMRQQIEEVCGPREGEVQRTRRRAAPADRRLSQP